MSILVILATFIAAAVEWVEALTIVLAVGLTRGWRSAFAGHHRRGGGADRAGGCLRPCGHVARVHRRRANIRGRFPAALRHQVVAQGGAPFERAQVAPRRGKDLRGDSEDAGSLKPSRCRPRSRRCHHVVQRRVSRGARGGLHRGRAWRTAGRGLGRHRGHCVTRGGGRRRVRAPPSVDPGPGERHEICRGHHAHVVRDVLRWARASACSGGTRI